MKYIDLVGVMETCSKYLSDPTNKQNELEFNTMKQSIIIRPYLTLKQKEAVLEKTLKDIQLINDENVSCVYTSMVEISLTFNALLAYTNIDSEIIDVMKSYEFYDLIWGSGLCDYIIKYCRNDYNRMTDMLYHMLSYENMFMLIGELKDVDTKSLDDLTKEFKEFRLNTNPESLIALGNISINNDPIIKNIKESIDEAAVKAIKRSNSKQKQKEKEKNN